MLKLFFVAALWAPCAFWGYYCATTDGRTSLGEASAVEWLIFWILAVAPYFVMTKVKWSED